MPGFAKIEDRKNVKTTDKCANLCNDDANCNSYEYSQYFKICLLNKQDQQAPSRSNTAYASCIKGANYIFFPDEDDESLNA